MFRAHASEGQVHGVRSRLQGESVSGSLPFVGTYRGELQLAALGDPCRRAIIGLLASGPTSVGELAGRLPVSRPAVSQHLRVLKDARLVADRPLGTRRLYSLDPEGAQQIRQFLEQFWQQDLNHFAAYVADQAEQTDPGE